MKMKMKMRMRACNALVCLLLVLAVLPACKDSDGKKEQGQSPASPVNPASAFPSGQSTAPSGGTEVPGNSAAPKVFRPEEINLAACTPESTASLHTAAGAGLRQGAASSSAAAANPARTPLDRIASISVGRIFDAAGYGWKPGSSYAIGADGRAWTWGYNSSGEHMSTPVQLQEEAAVRQISGSFVLTVDGQVRRMSDSGHSAAVPELAGVVSIQHLDEMFGILFALKEDGTVWYLKRDSSKPVRLGNYTGIASIYSTSFSLFLQDDNAQLHYINGSYGELLKNEAFLVPVPAPHKISQFSAGFDDEALILTEDGTVFLFSGSEKVLKPVPAMSGVKRLAAAGQGLYLFAKDDGTVWGLGKNRSGMLGPDADQALEPVQLPGLKAVTEIVAGTDHVLALNQQGEIYSWGSNMTGQLGRLDPVWDQWTEIGQLADVRQAVALPDRPYFIREGGAVWTMEEDGQAYPVQGLTRIKDMELMIDVPVTLSDEGTVHLWPGQFAGCQSLSVPFAVKDMAVNNEQLLLLDQEGNMVMVFLQAHRKERAGRYETTSFILDKRSITVKGADAWAGRIKSLHANPYAFLALTEDGQVFYTEKTGDGSYVFKQVEDLPAIKQLAAEYYIIGTVDPVPIWALDKEGRVHEINLELMRSSNKITSIKDTVLPEVEQGTARISGRLRITESGEIYERGWEKLPRQAAKHPVRLVSSSYSYAIEGPGSHYHLLVTENDRIVMMGYNLFGGASSKPDKVLAR